MGMSPSSGGSGKGRSAVAPAMNVTPLVDVVLVLLIIFMVVTPLLAKQLWLNLPKKDPTSRDEPPAKDDQRPVVLRVGADGAIRINQDEVAKGELAARLARIFAARGDGILYFDASDDAPFGAAVEVMDIARKGGGKTLVILTEKPGS